MWIHQYAPGNVKLRISEMNFYPRSQSLSDSSQQVSISGNYCHHFQSLGKSPSCFLEINGGVECRDERFLKARRWSTDLSLKSSKSRDIYKLSGAQSLDILDWSVESRHTWGLLRCPGCFPVICVATGLPVEFGQGGQLHVSTELGSSVENCDVHVVMSKKESPRTRTDVHTELSRDALIWVTCQFSCSSLKYPPSSPFNRKPIT